MTRDEFSSLANAINHAETARNSARDAYARAALEFARAQTHYFEIRHKQCPEFGEYSAAFRKFSNARANYEMAWINYQSAVADYNQALASIAGARKESELCHTSHSCGIQAPQPC